MWPPRRADLHHPLDPQHVPARLPAGLGPLKRDVKPDLHRRQRRPPHASRSTSSTDLGDRYPAIVRLWHNAWDEFVPFLDYDVEIRRVICSTNAIESLNARYRRAIKARGHFPTEQAA